MQSAFESLPRKNLEAAWTLGASKLDAFLSVAVPLSMRGFISAAVLSFAHTLGEFGVVLMVGGNIPGETRVVSIAIYDHVETLNYAAAHRLSLTLIVFAFVTLFGMFVINRRWQSRPELPASSVNPDRARQHYCDASPGLKGLRRACRRCISAASDTDMYSRNHNYLRISRSGRISNTACDEMRMPTCRSMTLRSCSKSTACWTVRLPVCPVAKLNAYRLPASCASPRD